MLCVVCVVGFERGGVGEEGENGAGIGDRRHPFFCACHITGSPSSKYEHRRTSALLRNVRNIRFCMGKKTYRFCNLRKWKDFNKKQLTLKCVLRLSCVVHGPIYGCCLDFFMLTVFSLSRLLKEKTVYIKTHKSALGPHRRDVTHNEILSFS